MAKVNPIPADYPRVTPYLAINGAAEALAWYQDVLGGSERMRMDGPDGTIGHAEVAFGDAVLMLADEYEEIGHVSPSKLGGTPVSICIYVEDVDAVFTKALQNGAKEIQPVEDKFYGDRAGTLEDPFGHKWNVMMHIEDVPLDEMAKRAKAAAETAG